MNDAKCLVAEKNVVHSNKLFKMQKYKAQWLFRLIYLLLGTHDL